MSRDQTVSDIAYAIWEAEGRPEGRDVEHWRLAEERVAASAGEMANASQPLRSKAAATTSRKPKSTITVRKTPTKSAGKTSPKKA